MHFANSLLSRIIAQESGYYIYILLTDYPDRVSKALKRLGFWRYSHVSLSTSLIDSDFYSYTVNLEECGNFKQMAAIFSEYTSNNFFDGHGNSDSKTIENWQLLKNQNVAKANYICRGENIMPTSKGDIAQTLIFKSQLAKYISTDIPRVAILSAYPIFLFDYLKVSM